ncbi:MAG TPA: hypothetical protein VFD07_00545, partial [Candidatus Krumholzibacteria bacterium]|nr:hypothetical protein [Candidatus Krumholzibacteria bacterium]
APIEAAAWSPYWYVAGGDSLVTYYMAFNRTLRASIIRGTDGTPRELVFHVPIGDVRAVRAGATGSE